MSSITELFDENKGVISIAAPALIGLLMDRPLFGIIGSAIVPLIYRPANDAVNDLIGIDYPYFGGDITGEGAQDINGVLWNGLDVPLINGDKDLTQEFLETLNSSLGVSNYDRLEPKFLMDLSTPVEAGLDASRVGVMSFNGTRLPIYHMGLVLASGTAFAFRYAAEVYSIAEAESLVVVNYATSFSSLGEKMYKGTLGLAPGGDQIPFEAYTYAEAIIIQVVVDTTSSIQSSVIDVQTTNENEVCVSAGSETRFLNVIATGYTVDSLFQQVISTREFRINAATEQDANRAWKALQDRYASGSLAVHFSQKGYSTWAGDQSVPAAEFTTYFSWWNWTCDTEIP